ncbi:unnamed protein product [Schistocephalus solidus]|uniref:Transposase n=1 Tax=Schistocephalus solidus TaxID=70667 RepID=A0A183TS12_SCHSO|nr:unnamed protein product [Schistocephalus solidus]
MKSLVRQYAMPIVNPCQHASTVKELSARESALHGHHWSPFPNNRPNSNATASIDPAQTPAAPTALANLVPGDHIPTATPPS